MMLKNSQKRKIPPMGRMRMSRRMRAFLFDFEIKGNRIRRMTENSVRGSWGIQS
ncbi:MAG: hypothetical protein HXY46_05490 [Syntrophaceae bacterium]|nr:hypothetical protein [Syntrophaceae bacterium]